MTLKEKIQNIGKKYGIKLSVSEPVKLSEAQTADGKMIYTPAEKWEVGVPCYEDAEGTKPCPDGEYELTTGETLIVSGGTVAAIEPAEEELTAEQALEAVDALTEKLDSVTANRDALTAELDGVKAELAALKTKANDLTIENTKLRKQAVADPKKQKLSARGAASATTDVTAEEWSKMTIAQRTLHNLSKLSN